MSDYYQEVLDYATEAHKGQYRWDRKTPYVTHPIAVAKIAETIYPKYVHVEVERIKDYLLPTVIATALLHDVLEDCQKTHTRSHINEFIYKTWVKYGFIAPERVMQNLDRLNKHNYFGYKDFTLAAKSDVVSRIVKIADITHNLSDLKSGSMRDKYELALYILEN